MKATQISGHGSDDFGRILGKLLSNFSQLPWAYSFARIAGDDCGGIALAAVVARH